MSRFVGYDPRLGALASAAAFARNMVRAAGILSPLQKPVYRYIHLGDSLTQGNALAFSANFGGWDLTWQTALASKGSLLPVYNAGVAGQTSPRIAARVIRDVLKRSPDVVGVTMGTNDVIALNSAAYITASLQAVYSALSSAGVLVFFTTIPPYAARAALVDTVNQAIRDFCSANRVPLVDFYAIANDPANPGNYRANYSADDIHPIPRVSGLWAEAAWNVLSRVLGKSKHQRTRVHEASNMLFPSGGGVGSTGLPNTATTPDGLMYNSRTYNSGGYNLTLPYLFGSVYTASGSAPTLSGALSDVADVSGKLFTLTATPNGAGSASEVISIANGSHFQGRRVRVSCILGLSGFDAQNTDAFIAGGGTTKANVRILANCRDNNNTAISSVRYTDPIDPGATLWDAVSFAMSTDWGADIGLQANDFTRRPISFEFNVAPGTETIAVEIQQMFTAAASGSVVMELGEFTIRDVGPALFPAMVAETDDFRNFRNLSASVTMTGATLINNRYFRCNATSGAQTHALPAATYCRGAEIEFKKVDSSANTVTIAANGAELIDGASTKVLSSQYDRIRLMCNGVGWDVVA